MPTPFSNDSERDAFLEEPRLAILMMNRARGAPIGVPVWFEWTGTEVLMFAATGTPKLRRIEKDPNVSVLVTNHIGEPEAWVAFDGTVQVSDESPSALIGRLGPRYWNLEDPQLKAMLDSWMEAEGMLTLLKLNPTRIRTGA